MKELILRPKPVPLAEFDQTGDRIIACPNPPSEAIKRGWAIAIPSSSFDVRPILKQLPFEPDLVSLSARVMTFEPRGLDALNCPTVMKLGDTFHPGDGGLSRIIRYCQQLNCDYHWTYQSPQHLHFFAESGLKNVFWLPASIVLDSYIPPASEKTDDVIFRGSKSELHCYRNYVLEKLSNIDVQTKDYITSLQDYAEARIVINTSLNGDLNRRVFEVLMAGGFLLSDRIRPETGLFELFEEGVHLECYGDETELSEKIQFYLAHPEKAAQIAAAGHRKFVDCYSPESIQQKLYHYIFKNEIEAPFRGEHDRRSQTAFKLQTRIQLYEFIQELQRLYPVLNILCYQIAPEIVSDLSDLSRSRLTYVQPNTQANLDKNATFQIVLADQAIEQCVSYLTPLGFLIVIEPRFMTIQQLNQQLEQHRCFPIELSVKLFEQLYPLTLEKHGIIYQKIIPEGDTQINEGVASLAVNRISSEKVINQQIKHLSIVRLAIKVLRSIRFLLRHP
ncbi:glycosyltransferase [Leptolyngbya sp. NIES-2104]|uniref:glycosyltransferase n=1 Tax=Leptolyngbya sp. NIES-2104 TaxID=1552121 RepID=UPI0006ECC57C|nr:glycosyltransferase [Leptolyngbya sp. NIES-2104]GAP97622.1 methyltransferase, FkbM family [Leptolyngbya sp. NIES-2104]